MKKSGFIFLLGLFSLTCIRTIAQDTILPPGYDIIGRGYDIFGYYADNSSLTPNPIFDFKKCTWSKQKGFDTPGILDLRDVIKNKIKNISGFTETQYTIELASNLKFDIEALYFSGTVNETFAKVKSKSEQDYFYTLMAPNIIWKISLIDAGDKLFSILDSQFKRDLDTLPPAVLFNQYGTYFIKNAYLGGRIDYSFIARMEQRQTTSELEAGASAKYKMISGQGKANEKAVEKLNKSVSFEDFEAKGGNANEIFELKDRKDSTQYRLWASGLKDHPVLCDFDKESLSPIWTLTKNPARQLELKNYFNDSILACHPLPEMIFNIKFKEIQVIKECENTDDAGEFKYSFQVNGNDAASNMNDDNIPSTTNGEIISLDKTVSATVTNKKDQSLHITGKVREVDNFYDDKLKPDINRTFTYPFADPLLNGSLIQDTLKKGDNCEVIVRYEISNSTR